jgi:uncharacterized repeat protein (TIGR01451 family)
MNRRSWWWAALVGVCFVSLSVGGQHAELLGPDQMGRCEEGLFVITFSASAVQTASQIIVTNTRSPNGFEYVSGSATVTLHEGPPLSAEPDQVGLDLVWNLDVLLGAAYELPPGEQIGVSFELETSCGTVSGNNEVQVEYLSDGTPGIRTDALSTEILPGAVLIYKEPGVIEARVGDVVEWTLTLENTGFGAIYNVVVTDLLGSGLSYDSSTPAGSNVGQTTVWEIDEIPAGETVGLVLRAEVTACSGLDNQADVRFGCDDGSICFDTEIQGGTATASILLLLENPLLDWSPPTVEMPYCDPDGVQVTIPITNEGDGPARNLRFCMDCDPLVVENVQAGAEYIGGCFVLDDPLLGGETFTLQFTVRYPGDWCAGVPSGTVICQTFYENVCGVEFQPPINVGSFSTTYGSSGAPSLSAAISGPGETYVGNLETYNVSAGFSGLSQCGDSGETTDVAVSVGVPDGFTVEEAGGGTWTPGAGGTGGTIVWILPSDGPALNTQIDLRVPGTVYCNTIATATISATAVDCCGCALSSSGSTTTAIQCDEFVDSSRSASPSTVTKCASTTYTNAYNFLDADVLDAITFGDLVFTDYADNAQQYVLGTLEVLVDGAPVSATVTDTTPAGTLVVSGINGTWGATSVRGTTLVIRYDMEITPESSPTSCPGTATFYTWSSLDLGVGCDPDFLGECTKFEVTQVIATTPSMSVSVSGLPSVVDRCGSYPITITLTRTSVDDPYDVTLRLEDLNYYMIDPGFVVCSGGVAPVSCTPSQGAGEYTWTFGDAFVGQPVGSQAVIQATVRKTCGSGRTLSAQASYRDLCGDPCSSSGSSTPSLLRSPILSVLKTPEIIYATRNEVNWTVYVTNSGSGHAYEVWVDDLLGDGLEYVSSTVTPSAGVVATPNQDHNGFPINGVSWYIPEILAGATHTITLTARLETCQDLTNEVGVGYGCGGDECAIPSFDDSVVMIPTTSLTATSFTETPIDICDVQPATIRIRNSGDPAVYEIVATETLPTGVAYVMGSTEWRIGTGAWTPGLDPIGAGSSALTWTSTQVSGQAELLARRTLEIRFAVQALCDYDGGSLLLAVDYKTVCGDDRSLPIGSFTVSARKPDLSVTKTQTDPPAGGAVDCGGEVTWRIDVTNTGEAPAEYVWVRDSLGDGFVYVSSLGDGLYSVDNGCDAGGEVTWVLQDLPEGVTASLFLTAQESGCGALTNEVESWWGCGTSVTSCINDGLCLTSAGASAGTTGTREPSVSLSTSLSPTSIGACGQAAFALAIQNTSTATASDLDARVTLPAGLSYVPGTTEIDCGAGFLPAADPVEVGQQLSWVDEGNLLSNLCDAVLPGETIRLRFVIQASCYLTAQNAGVTVWYYDCCLTAQDTVSATRQIAPQLPVLTITKTPATDARDCFDDTDTVTWTMTVTNTGSATADWVRLEDTLGTSLVYVGSSPAATSMGGQAWGWEFGPLAPGASQSVQLTAYATQPVNDCSTAPRTNTARVSWGCGLFDGDPTTADGCTGGGPVTATARVTVPDLTLNSTDITPTLVCVEDGDYSGSVSLRVRNAGDAAVTQDFRMTISESTTSWVVTGWFAADFGGVLPISAGGNRLIQVAGWPVTCGACDYTFTVTLDTESDICECRENNNTTSRTWTITLPNVSIVSEDVSLSCAADGQVLISGTVTLINEGCGAALTANVPMQFTLYDRSGCTGISVDQWTQVFTGVNMPVGGTQTFTLTPRQITVDLCTVAAGCGVSLFVETDYNDSICECGHAGNTTCIDVPVDIPSLTISAEALDLACSGDGEVSISGTVTLANDGCGDDLTADVPMRFTLYGGPGCGGTILDQWTEVFGSVSLAPGGGTQVFTITSRTSSQNLCGLGCEVRLLIEADYDASICECSGTNNTQCVALPVGIPDLAVLSVVPNVPDACTTGTVNVTVQNVGCVSAAEGILTRITGDVTGETTLPALDPGQSATVTVTLNEVLPCGSYSLTATADPDELLCECSSADNAMVAPFDVVDPDLAVLNLFSGCNVDGSFDVTAEIHNLGTQHAPSSVVRIYLNGALVHQETLAELAIGAQQLVEFTSASLPCGEGHVFRMVVDEDGDICECNTANNEQQVEASCPCPALVTDKRVEQILRGGTPISVAGPIEPGDVITYVLQVSNVGGGWAYDVYVTDRMPQEFAYVGGTTEAVWPMGSFTDDPAGAPGPDLEWILGATLAGGEALSLTFGGLVTSDIRQGFTYTNTMWAAGTEGDGTEIPQDSSPRVPEDDDPEDSSFVTLPTVVPALQVEKTITDVLRSGAGIWPTDTVEPGDLIAYRVDIRNVGTGTAYNVGFSDALPYGVTYDTSLGDGTYTVDAPAAGPSTLGISHGATGSLSADLGATVEGGGTLVAVYRVRVTSEVAQSVDLVNVARATGADGAGSPIAEFNDDVSDGFPDEDQTQVGVWEPALAVDKAIVEVLRNGASIGPATVALWGDVIVYEVTVRNIGLGTAYNVDIADELPFGVAYDTTVEDGTYTVDVPSDGPISLGIADGATGRVEASIGATIAGGGTLAATYRVRVLPEAIPGAYLTNLASAVGVDGADTPIPPWNDDTHDASPDEDDDSIRVGAPALTTDKAIYCDRDACVPDQACAPCEPDPLALDIGMRVPFELTITNVGYSEAYAVHIEDMLPPGFAYIPESTVMTWPDGRLEGADAEPLWKMAPEEASDDLQQVLWWPTLIALDAGGELVLIFEALVTSDAPVAETIRNTMWASAVDAFGSPIPADSREFVPEDDDLTDSSDLGLFVRESAAEGDGL